MSKRSNTIFLFGRLNNQQFFINTMKTSFNFYDDIYNGPGFGCTKGRSSHHRFRWNISIFSWELRLGRSCFIVLCAEVKTGVNLQRLFSISTNFYAIEIKKSVTATLQSINQLQLHICNKKISYSYIFAIIKSVTATYFQSINQLTYRYISINVINKSILGSQENMQSIIQKK